MIAALRRGALPVLIGAAWLGVLAWWTSGFRAFTTDTHALVAAGPLPRPSPVFPITDQLGRTYDTAQLRGRWVLLNFMYLHCSGVCYVSMAKFNELSRIVPELVPARLVLLSVSFDPQRDTVPALRRFWAAHGEPDGWVMAHLTASLGPETQAQMRRIGMWVRRQPDGEYSHAVSSFLIDPAGKVVWVFRAETQVAELARQLRERVG